MSDFLEPSSHTRTVSGIDQGYAPRLRHALMHLHSVLSHIESNVRHVQRIVREVFLDEVAFVATT
jgi:hypothetical protein